MCHTSLHAQCFLAVLQLPPAWLAALLLSLLLSPKWRKTGCEALVGAHPWLPLLSTLVCLPWGECFCLPGEASCPAAQLQVPSQAAPSGHTEGTLCSWGCELQAWSLQISCHPLPDCFLVPSGCGLPPSDPFQLAEYFFTFLGHQWLYGRFPTLTSTSCSACTLWLLSVGIIVQHMKP